MNIIDILPREGFDPCKTYVYEIFTAAGWQEVCRFGGARWASALREACEERAEGHYLAPVFWTRDDWHQEGLGYPDWEWAVEVPGQPAFEFDTELEALAAYEQATINHGWTLIHADVVPALTTRRMREVQP